MKDVTSVLEHKKVRSDVWNCQRSFTILRKQEDFVKILELLLLSIDKRHCCSFGKEKYFELR